MLAKAKTLKLLFLRGRRPEGTEDKKLLAKSTIGKYELGETLGEGNFGIVKVATNVITKEYCAIKIIDKKKIAEHGMEEQIIREIQAMKRVSHPNVIQLQEVMASRSRVYMVLELVSEGQLLDKVKVPGGMEENEARMYFRQLINAIDFCHSRGVYHRDIKPDNLLLNSEGQLKLSDFGLSALEQHVREDGLLHSKCGTRGYIAPEVLYGNGYDGDKADLFSCGVTLHFLLAGHLPFPRGHRVRKGDFALCKGFSPGSRRLIRRMLDPEPDKRITISDILQDEWFNATEPGNVASTSKDVAQKIPNMKQQIKFTCKHPAKVIISTLQNAVQSLGFIVQKSELNVEKEVLSIGLIQLEDQSRGSKGNLKVETRVYDLASQFAIVEISKTEGDTLEFHELYKNLTTGIKDVIWNYDEQMEEIQ